MFCQVFLIFSCWIHIHVACKAWQRQRDHASINVCVKDKLSLIFEIVDKFSLSYDTFD